MTTEQTTNTPLAAAKAKLADLRAELDARTEDYHAAAARATELEGRISRLTAEGILDNIDHSGRILKAQQELAQCESAIDAWSDVEKLLRERIAAAEAAHFKALEADRQQQLAVMDAQEAALRKKFAAAAAKVFEIGAELGDLHAARDAMRVQMTDELVYGQRATLAGAPVNMPLPVFPARLLFQRQSLELAKAQLQLRNG